MGAVLVGRCTTLRFCDISENIFVIENLTSKVQNKVYIVNGVTFFSNRQYFPGPFAVSGAHSSVEQQVL